MPVEPKLWCWAVLDRGTETPASATMRRYAALAAQRLARSPAAECTVNLVTFPDGRLAQGAVLLRGDAACRQRWR